MISSLLCAWRAAASASGISTHANPGGASGLSNGESLGVSRSQRNSM